VIRAPELLAKEHDLTAFRSGEQALDDWLRRRALANQRSGASRTYVVTANDQVIGYYSLAAGAILPAQSTGKVRRNMPNPIPVMVLGRLAVDQTWQGQGLGADLLRDALLRTIQAAEITGIRALLVHALHEKAAAFYSRFGFRPSPIQPMTYMLLLDDARSMLQRKP